MPCTQQPRSGIYWAQAVPRSSSAARSTSSQPACLKHVHAGLQPKASLALSLGVLAALIREENLPGEPRGLETPSISLSWGFLSQFLWGCPKQGEEDEAVPSSLPWGGVRPGSYLAVQQLRLRPPIAFDLIADAVEERYAVLLLVAAGKLPQHLPGLLCKGREEEGRVRLGLASGTPCSPPHPPPTAPTRAGCALGTRPQHRVLMGAAAPLLPQVGQPHKVTPGSAPFGPCASHVALLGTFAPFTPGKRRGDDPVPTGAGFSTRPRPSPLPSALPVQPRDSLQSFFPLMLMPRIPLPGRNFLTLSWFRHRGASCALCSPAAAPQEGLSLHPHVGCLGMGATPPDPTLKVGPR